MKMNNMNEVNDSQNPKTVYEVITECAVSLTKNYILQLAVSSESDLTIAVGLSNDPCVIYKLNNDGLKKISSIKCHEEPITELKFDKSDHNLFYSSSLDGTIKMWDLRDVKQPCQIFQGQKLIKAPLLSFDTDATSRLLCGGSEHTDGDAFLIFWDLRSSKILGGYWESHDDDITQVVFHSINRNMMMSGSTDGLINVFDISQSTEDDSLLYTYNTMNSVQKLNWINEKKHAETISCITHTNDLQIWDMNSCLQTQNFERSDITKYSERIKHDDCYLINTFVTKDLETLVLIGSNANDGECLEALQLSEDKLQHAISFPKNKQIIRSSWFDNKSNMFILGGESGMLSVLKSNNLISPQKTQNNLKILNKKMQKMKPY